MSTLSPPVPALRWFGPARTGLPTGVVICEKDGVLLQVCDRRDKKASMLLLSLLLELPTETRGFWVGIDIGSGCEALLVSL
jgi:molybdopterin/thiamine biosynthesis adenylyltransferase